MLQKKVLVSSSGMQAAIGCSAQSLSWKKKKKKKKRNRKKRNMKKKKQN